jgi:peptide/nickel transport system substrate-binding protein
MQGRHIEFARLPVYKQNETKGDYTVVLTPTTPGTGLVFNQTWEGDDEIEKWIRNREFRLALALGLDREEFRQSLFLGQGELGHNLPKADHPWYLGEELYNKNATFEPDRANQILDDLGLTEKDSEGNRLRTDGSGKPIVLECYTTSRANTVPFVELISSQWTQNLGIKTVPKPLSRSQREGLRSADAQMIDCGGSYISPRSIPNLTWPFQVLGGKWGTWWQTDGAEGIQPPDGPYRRLQNIYGEANILRIADRKDLYVEGWNLYIDNVMGTGITRHYPSHMIVIKNNVRNVLLNAPPQYQYPGEIHLDQMYFEGGKNSAGF